MCAYANFYSQSTRVEVWNHVSCYDMHIARIAGLSSIVLSKVGIKVQKDLVGSLQQQTKEQEKPRAAKAKSSVPTPKPVLGPKLEYKWKTSGPIFWFPIEQHL
ncbi:hypothetical protein E2P81_ATG02354 [Venturia nashicola]|uniref:Uncharacterized protein n=1 Tax=Venturia nashicola TaxID=86259 RepID=A0A4Z1PAC6_9PEZI|nr:hypothetical protein E6O75_ATG02414 [Venturia nashicola]TLD36572.1 hypothetical protein E2P81_ATG02354 [Venturia nashicola]